jgi:hypothetical protein
MFYLAGIGFTLTVAFLPQCISV